MFRILILLFSMKKRYSLENKQFKILFLFIILFWYSSAGFLYFELPAKPDLNWFDSMWWTVVTMATVGYGDIFPTTIGGRFLIGVPTIIFGVGILTFLVSQIAMKMIESQSRRLRGMASIKLSGHILIVNFSKEEEILNLVLELKADPQTKRKGICLIDDTLEEIPRNLLDYNVEFVRGNPTSEATLKQANFMNASSALILSKDRSNPHSDDRNLAIIVMMEKMYPEICTIAEIVDPHKTQVFELAGCNSVICTSGWTANFIIKELLDPGAKNIFTELWSNQKGKELYYIPIKKRASLTYKDLVLWCLGNSCSIIGLSRGGNAMLNPAPTEIVMDGDRAILIADDRIAEIDAG